VSTNSADMNRPFYTVAELVARERTATESYPWARREQRPRALVPASELLRREGVRIDAVPVEEETQVHVAKLLRREAELPSADGKKSRRIAAVASAAALSGLTIAGLIALNPTSSTPNGNSASGVPDGQQVDGTTTERDDVTPTTSVLKRASNEKQADDAKRKAADAKTTDATGSSTGGGAGDGAGGSQPDSPADTPDQPAPPSGTNSPTPPPSDSNPPKPPPDEEEPDNGGPLDDVVGGVGDVVGGVGDAVGGVTDTVGGVLNPVTGSVSGTLNLGG